MRIMMVPVIGRARFAALPFLKRGGANEMVEPAVLALALANTI